MFNRKNNRGKMNSENENNEELKEENVAQETTNNEEKEENQDESAPVQQKSELELAQEAVLVSNDKYLRLYSEFDNFRKRTAKEKLDTIKSASEDVIKNMLPIVDDFKRAMAHNQEVNDADAIKQGFELIYNKLFKSLETKGLKKIDAMGEVFNADIHEAITQIPAPEPELKGKVVDVVEEGYYLGDKIIRFPKVVIGQ